MIVLCRRKLNVQNQNQCTELVNPVEDLLSEYFQFIKQQKKKIQMNESQSKISFFLFFFAKSFFVW